ncbi:ABC transporter ATP-binding protein [Mammaliicoccus lentus]|uniref:ABC transporter ATP-binding protein n=1 Tax=Mammaliicoccus lentus TaxID=42858 RepID=UPI00374E45B1
MDKNYKIACENVSKVYDLTTNKKEKLLSLFTFGLLKKKKYFFALKDINFTVKEGTSVGILGLNGSGKTTLSNILGGVSKPTVGNIHSDSSPSLIAIGAGLNNNFTGIENIHFKCLMHGMTQKEINNKLEDIIAFSELDDFIFQPLKSYSSGMRSRLGFAIAIHTDPDILIVDEALSVGDQTFSNKCISKMKELQKEGKTIFFVSHSATQIKAMCDEAMWIHYGILKEYDTASKVISHYNEFIKDYKLKTKKEQLAYKKHMIKSQQKLYNTTVPINEYRPSFSTLGIIGVLLVIVLYMGKLQLGL